jgi:hypothetical protein
MDALREDARKRSHVNASISKEFVLDVCIQAIRPEHAARILLPLLSDASTAF